MAEPKKPDIAPPINAPNAGKIVVIVSGPTQVKSGDPRIVVQRRD